MHITWNISTLLRNTFTSQICNFCTLCEPVRISCNPCKSSLFQVNNLMNLGRPFSNSEPVRCIQQNRSDSYTIKIRSPTSNKVMMSSVSDSIHSSLFRLEDYDCVGFDLDNTLCEYNITPSVEMEYSYLANFLVKEKGYDPDYLLRPLDELSLDFLQKGLLVDFARGNILKVVEDGVISRASHGTKLMSNKEIIYAYGEDRKWEVTTELSRNMLAGWNGPLSERVRALLDYFDMPASIAFARIIDALDNKLGKPADMYNVWPDVRAGLHNMYKREHFSTGEGGYFKEIKSNPHKFIKTCSPEVVEWLKEIKRSKLTFLITGSNCDFASFTAETGLGKNWRSLFDVVVCYARKPGFFTGCRPFVELNGFEETEPVMNGSIELGKMYNQGNWQELFQLFSKTLGKQSPRCLYFGDNLVQDIYTPSKYTKCDTVAIVEELSVESHQGQQGDTPNHPSLPVLTSKFWDSYFVDDKENLNNLWGSILHNHAKICIPSLSFLAQFSVSHEFKTFYQNHGGGYYPSGPVPSEVKKKINVV